MPMQIVIPIGTGTTVGQGVNSYSGLISTVGIWLNRDDLAIRIPDFITLLEARLNRILRTPEMEATTTLTTDAESLDLPDDFREIRGVYLDTDPRQRLDLVNLSVLRKSYACQTTGKPEVYAVSGTQMLLGPAPDDEYDLELAYYQEIPALSETNETNWLILDHPDVYLFGTLLMAESFLWNDERIPLWKAAWDEALSELTGQGNKMRMSGAPLRLRPSVSE